MKMPLPVSLSLLCALSLSAALLSGCNSLPFSIEYKKPLSEEEKIKQQLELNAYLRKKRNPDIHPFGTYNIQKGHGEGEWVRPSGSAAARLLEETTQQKEE